MDSHQERGYEDPLTLYNIGNVIIQVHASEELLHRAGKFIDLAYESELEEKKVVESSIAVAEAKALASEAALLATNKLFELAGTKSTLQEFNYDRHWRNARAHTLHDPVRWKYYAVGNYFLNGEYRLGILGCSQHKLGELGLRLHLILLSLKLHYRLFAEPNNNDRS